MYERERGNLFYDIFARYRGTIRGKEFKSRLYIYFINLLVLYWMDDDDEGRNMRVWQMFTIAKATTLNIPTHARHRV